MPYETTRDITPGPGNYEIIQDILKNSENVIIKKRENSP